MIGSFLTRGLVMILGYAYPAYECYKTVEKNRPEIEQLRFWCQYWILIALMTVFERVGDAFVSWLPMYGEAKLAFIIYLWYPRTKGTTYVYGSFFKPYVSKHENEIDRNLLELRTRAGDMAFMYCQRAVSYGQTRIVDVLQYVAMQSTPRPRAAQTEQEAPRTRQAPAAGPAPAVAASRQPATKVAAAQPQPQVEEPLSPSSSTSSSQQEEMDDDQSSTSTQGTSTSAPAPAPASPIPSLIKKSVSMPVAPESPRRSVTQAPRRSTTEAPRRSTAEAPRRSLSTKTDVVQVESAANKAEKPASQSPTPEETVMEETIRVTRGRLRKTRSTVDNN